MKKTIVHVGTYLPFKEGISTYTNNLLEAQKKIYPNFDFRVVALDLVGYKKEDYPDEVRWIITKDNLDDYKNTATQIESNPGISCIYLQHEYGIYGGEYGEYILEFLANVGKPVYTTLHTTLPEPSPKMQEVTQKIIDYSRKIVVMTRQAKDTVVSVYNVSPSKVHIIRHGIHPSVFVTPEEYKAATGIRDRFILGTFGFLGTGKGIEYVIRALPKVIEKFPNTEYWLMGKTHPLVLKNQGESYRERLLAEAKELGLTKHIKFYNKYLSTSQILKFLKMVDIYIVTALEPTQAVSGTFSYALGSGRPLVSTGFFQAKEFMKQDFGELVDFKNPDAYADALIKLLSDFGRRKRIQKRAYHKTRGMIWPNVANFYLELNNEVNGFPDLKLDHLIRMTDDFGFIQFAKETTPNLSYGYTLDDNARSLIFTSKYYEKHPTKKILNLIETYLDFIEFCQRSNGEFNNYVDKEHRVTHDKPWENLEDSNARALWSLGTVISARWLPIGIRKKAKLLWDKWQNGNFEFHHPRAIAFYIKGLWYRNDPIKISQEADRLLKYYDENASGSWKWFLQELTYANGILPEALFLAYDDTKDRKYLRVAIITTKFLIDHTFNSGLYLPIGQAGWFKRNGERSYFDQQPEDPYSMISLLLTAFKITKKKNYYVLARRVMLWFYGNNILGVSVYDPKSGGTHDGITPNGVNADEGAESTVSYLLALHDIKSCEKLASERIK
jgi:glycosyltransferase involved in cell wall biosynthesis